MGDFFEKGAEKVFPEFDVRSVAEQLGAEKQGRDDGLTDLPPASASSLSLAESEIVSHFANLVSGSKSSARHFLSNFREQILEVDLPGALDVVRACPRQLEAAFATLEQEHREDLRDRTLLEGEALRSLKDFKSEHGLTRQAKQRQEIIFQILLFLVFIGLEGGLNAWFFALASDKGLLGGFFTAIVVSIINVTGGFLAGYFAICSLYHKDYMRKALGMLALLVCGLFSISVNLFAGHYRSALEKDPLSAVNVAVSSFKSNWLGIDSVQGWILCAFGLLLAIVFAIKSFYYDDPYPGYGEKFREHRKAKEELMQAQQAFTNMNKQLGEEYHDKVIARMIDAARQAMGLERLISQSKVIVDKFSDYSQRAETACQAVINLYRKANTEVRESDPPDYFVLSPAPPFAGSKLDESFEEREARLAEFQRKLDEFRESDLPKVKSELDNIILSKIASLEGFLDSLRGSQKVSTKRKMQSSPESLEPAEG